MNTNIIVKEIFYESPEYYLELELRNDVLRKPLGMNLYDQDLTTEKNYIRIAAFNENQKIMGTLLLVPQENGIIQMKQMAVRESAQGMKIGKKIIQFAEDLIISKGFSKIILNARKIALPFYLKFGYEIQGGEFQEVGIPHFKMSKIVK
jgi:predicted GNAT family N-acyltransferase